MASIFTLNIIFLLIFCAYLQHTFAEEDLKYFYSNGEDISYDLEAPIIDSSSRTNQPFSYNLKWSQESLNANLTLYKIRYRKDVYPLENNFPWNYLSVLGNQTSSRISDLEPSSLYQVEMVAIGDRHLSELSLSSFRTGVDYSAKQRDVEVVTATTVENDSGRINKSGKNKGKRKSGKNKRVSKLPEPPTALTVTYTSQSSISLRWNPRSNGGSPIIKYKIQMKVTDGPEKTKWKTIKKTLNADTKNCEITGLKRGLPYKFRVIAVNSFGSSRPSQSTEERLSVMTSVGLTKAPEVLSVHMVNTSTISVEWKYTKVPVSIVNGFTVAYWSTSLDMKEEIINDPSANKVELGELTPGLRYYIKMQAYNIQSESDYSHLKSFLMPAQTNQHIGDGLSIIDAVYNTTTTRPKVLRYTPHHNKHARAQVTQRDIAFVIAGGVTAFIVIILVVSAVVYHKSKNFQKQIAESKHGHKYLSHKQTCNGEKCNLTQYECERLYAQKYSCSSFPGTASPSQYSQTSSYYPSSFDQSQRSDVYCQQYSGYNVPRTWVRGWNGDGNFCHLVNGKQNNPTKNMVTANTQTTDNFTVTEDQNLLVSKENEAPTEDQITVENV